MKVVPDLPSVDDLDRLEHLLADRRLDRAGLADVLGRLGQSLQEHADDLDRSGGVLTRKEEAARPSLARQAEKLRLELAGLIGQAGELSLQTEQSTAEEDMRRRARELLNTVRQLRDREADLKLESVVTDIGSGD